MWSVSYTMDEHPFEISVCLYSLAGPRGPDSQHIGPCLSVPLVTLNALSAEKLTELVEWFKQEGEEIATIHSASEAHMSSQFVSDDDLEMIVQSKHADDEIKAEARKEIDQRRNPMGRTYDDDEPLPKERKEKPGYVYLVRADNGTYKIGRSAYPKRRIKELGVKLPWALEVIHLIKTDSMIDLEEGFHAHFEEQRLSGEWFDLTDEDVAFIKEF